LGVGVEGAAEGARERAAEPSRDVIHWDPADPTPQHYGPTFELWSCGYADNRALEARPDVLVYTSAPYGEDALEFAGWPTVAVRVSSSAVSADVFARLCLVDPATGESINVSEGVKRKTLARGEAWPHTLTIRLSPVCACLSRGWRLRLVLAGGSFPQYSRNLGYGEPNATAVRMTKADHTVEWEGGASWVELPVVRTQRSGGV